MTETKTTKARAAKSASQTAANTDVFGLQNMEVPSVVRDFAEQSIEKAKDSYTKMKSAAEDATDIMEDSYETSRQGVMEINMKALDVVKTSTDAAFSFYRDLLAVKSVAEAVELQSAFAHQQFDTSIAQAKEMQDLVTKVATEATQPAKDAIQKSVTDLQAA